MNPFLYFQCYYWPMGGVISMLDTYNWMFLSATTTKCWMAALLPSELWFDEGELDVLPMDKKL